MIDQIKQNQFKEITNHLLEDEKPSDFITSLSQNEDYSGFPYNMLWKLKTTEQSKIHHPEGSVWNHSMLVLDEAAKVREQSKDKKIFMWSALLHDIGKPSTTRNRHGKITSYDHDKEGEKLSKEFLSQLTEDQSFIEKTSSMVRFHMHMLYVIKALPYGDVESLLQRVDIDEIALLCRCDRLGRTGANIHAEEAEYKEFLSKLKYRLNKVK